MQNVCLLLQIIPRIYHGRHATITTHDEVSPNEWVKIAIEHAVHISDFDLGPMVFGDAVGLQHIRPDL